MIVGCCKEPVAGPVVDARVLRHAWTSLGPLALGDWPAPYSLQSHRRAETRAVLDEVLAGLYLAVDADGQLRWLGKSHRDGGVGTRPTKMLGKWIVRGTASAAAHEVLRYALDVWART